MNFKVMASGGPGGFALRFPPAAISIRQHRPATKGADMWAEVHGVLTPKSPWWKATPAQARAAHFDDAVLIERLRDGTQRVFVLAP